VRQIASLARFARATRASAAPRASTRRARTPETVNWHSEIPAPAPQVRNKTRERARAAPPDAANRRRFERAHPPVGDA